MGLALDGDGLHQRGKDGERRFVGRNRERAEGRDGERERERDEDRTAGSDEAAS